MLLTAGVLGLTLLIMVVALGYWRWHPMLTLLLCAFLVAVLTPASAIEMSELREKGVRIDEISESGFIINSSQRSPKPGRYLWLQLPKAKQSRSPFDTEYQLAKVEVVAVTAGTKVGQWRLETTPPLESETLQKIQPQVQAGVVWGMEESSIAAAQRSASLSAVARISKGFGGTVERIGVMIVLASIIGSCLLASGSANVIVTKLMSLLGEKRVTIALVMAGFILGIPVFFDTVFLLLLPIAISLYQTTRQSYFLVIMSVVVGATMAHSLVPPTPGPLLVADALDVDMATAMGMGCVVGSVTIVIGWLSSSWLGSRWPIDGEQVNRNDAAMSKPVAAESVDNDGVVPSFGMAVMPILLPMLMLGGHAIFEMLVPYYESLGRIESYVHWIGEKEIALGLATILAVIAVVRRGIGHEQMARVIQEGLSMGATVLLVTAAGGAFGDVIRQTDISGAFADSSYVPQGGVGLLLLAFLVTAVVRVLQGSATVAMFTAIGLIQPWIDPALLGYHPVYLALAIGCGSKMCPWMNDSGFWLVGRMAGLTPTQTLRSFSLVLSIMGLAGLVTVLLLAKMFPLV